ncbi:MAG: family 10 glycosylhydrolase [Leptolyngbyaceae cyanobacterium SL_7_1]|nr:family 10 glycosylhydrolase [Leptolyngbyaceae cyanobacterium SL_7_1]
MVNRRLQWLVLGVVGLAIALGLRFPTIALAQSHTASVSELRGVWLTNIDSDVLFSKDNLEQAIQRLAQLNFNTIYPTVWNGGYTLYPSTVAEEATGAAIDPTEPGLADRDMVAEAIELGHAKGLAVIPWFEFGLMAPADSELARRHPDWITRRRNGDEIVMQGEFPRVWLNPAHPQVQQFMVDLIVEAVTRYDLDGIQFDDHFGMPHDLGYDDYTIERYKQEHAGQLPPDNPDDPDWLNWRSDHVTELMIRLFTAIRTRKPDCTISLSPNPRAFSYERYLQNWSSWERLGFVDELIVQLYRTDLDQFVSELNRLDVDVNRRYMPVSVGILSGLRVLPVETAQIEQQVRTVRDRQFSGVSFFFYATPQRIETTP